MSRADRARLAQLLDRDLTLNVYLRSELRIGADAAEWWGALQGERLIAACLAGALLVPCLPDPTAAPALAAALRAAPPVRLMVGPRDQVLSLHGAFMPARVAREVRAPQPVLVLDRGDLGASPDNGVRRADPGDLEALAVAAASMHHEEMGMDPYAGDPAGWRRRMASFIDRGWSWVWTEAGEVVFKAELSAWTPEVAQLQGVYTSPRHRRRGIAHAGLAAVCAQVLASVPRCTLYVNGYNTGALRLYAGLGFRPAGTFATVIYKP